MFQHHLWHFFRVCLTTPPMTTLWELRATLIMVDLLLINLEVRCLWHIFRCCHLCLFHLCQKLEELLFRSLLLQSRYFIQLHRQKDLVVLTKHLSTDHVDETHRPTVTEHVTDPATATYIDDQRDRLLLQQQEQRFLNHLRLLQHRNHRRTLPHRNNKRKGHFHLGKHRQGQRS